MGDRERSAREGIAKTAAQLRREAERAGKPMTQTQAEARVRHAVRKDEQSR